MTAMLAAVPTLATAADDDDDEPAPPPSPQLASSVSHAITETFDGGGGAPAAAAAACDSLSVLMGSPGDEHEPTDQEDGSAQATVVKSIAVGMHLRVVAGPTRAVGFEALVVRKGSLVGVGWMRLAALRKETSSALLRVLADKAAEKPAEEAQPEQPVLIGLPDVDDGTESDDVQLWYTSGVAILPGTTLACTWRDQGWGGAKGRLFARRAGESEWVSVVDHVALHDSEDLTLALPSSVTGGKLELGYTVGGGGGHEMHICNARLDGGAGGGATRENCEAFDLAPLDFFGVDAPAAGDVLGFVMTATELLAFRNGERVARRATTTEPDGAAVYVPVAVFSAPEADSSMVAFNFGQRPFEHGMAEEGGATIASVLAAGDGDLRRAESFGFLLVTSRGGRSLTGRNPSSPAEASITDLTPCSRDDAAKGFAGADPRRNPLYAMADDQPAQPSGGPSSDVAAAFMPRADALVPAKGQAKGTVAPFSRAALDGFGAVATQVPTYG